MSKQYSPSDCIINLLVLKAKNGTRSWKNNISDLGVTAAQARVLAVMYESGDVSASELSSITAIDNATLTGILDRLEAMNAVNRLHDPSDRRSIRLRLTTDGERLAADIYSRVDPANKEFLANLTETETSMLEELLRRL